MVDGAAGSGDPRRTALVRAAGTGGCLYLRTNDARVLLVKISFGHAGQKVGDGFPRPNGVAALAMGSAEIGGIRDLVSARLARSWHR